MIIHTKNGNFSYRPNSEVPRENIYTVVTGFNKTLNFDQEMQGKAEIVTEDLRLIERFFYQILKIFKA